LRQLSSLLTINAQEQIVALNAIFGWLPRVDVQHVGRLARCYETEGAAFNNYDLCIDFINSHGLGKGHLHLSASKRQAPGHQPAARSCIPRPCYKLDT